MSFRETLSGPLGQWLACTLFHFVWQGFLIAVGVAAIGCLLSRAQARGRYAVALGGLALMACCPLITLAVVHVSAPSTFAFTPVPRLPGPEPQPPTPVQSSAVDAASASPPSSPDVAASAPSVAPSPEPTSIEPDWRMRLSHRAAAIRPYAVMAWLVGVVVLGGRLVLSVVGIRRLARCCLPVSGQLAARATRLAQRLRLSAAPGVYLSHRIREAMLVGLWRPMVLLPVAWVAEMPPDVLEAVIAHELAHVRRFDLWTNLLQRLVETLLFYHPAVRWLSRHTSLLREMCADELPVQTTGDRMTYAGVLELLGRRRLKLPAPQLAATIAGKRMALFARVRNVLNVAPGDERLRWWPAGFLALLVPVGMLSLAYLRAEATVDTPKDARNSARKATEWSETLNGLRVRLLAPMGTTYRQGVPLPLVAEVQNNSKKPIACNLLWHTVRFRANDADGKWIGIARMGPELGNWVGQSADLAPGKTTQLGLCLQSLRFNRPLRAGETIQLQAGAPTQKSRTNQLPLEVFSPALDMRMQNDFPPDFGNGDLPAEWRMNLACELNMGLIGNRQLQVDERGAAKLLNHFQRNGQRFNDCLQTTLPPARLNELAVALMRIHVWKLNQIPQAPPAPDAGCISLTLMCPTGASMVGEYSSQLESRRPIIAELRKLVETLMDDIEKTAKASAAKPAREDNLAIDLTVVGIDGTPAD
jgi:beta-lactamase regulating signal transducer with metallopeptidase domain